MLRHQPVDGARQRRRHGAHAGPGAGQERVRERRPGERPGVRGVGADDEPEAVLGARHREVHGVAPGDLDGEGRAGEVEEGVVDEAEEAGEAAVLRPLAPAAQGADVVGAVERVGEVEVQAEALQEVGVEAGGRGLGDGVDWKLRISRCRDLEILQQYCCIHNPLITFPFVLVFLARREVFMDNPLLYLAVTSSRYFSSPFWQ